MNTDRLLAEEKPTHYRDFAASVTPGLDPNGPDVVATITCDSVDADKEVVLPEGADLSRYIKAPRVMLCHAYGRPGEYYPLPIGKALWTKRQGRAIVQGIRFARSSAMGREVQGLFEEAMLNTFSIGFVSLESSRPTTQEKSIHPEWREVNLIHRRWKLLEVSVVPIPCNEDAIGVYLRKGKPLPAFVWVPDSLRKMHAMATDPLQPSEHQEQAAALSELREKALSESSGTAAGYATQLPSKPDKKESEPRNDSDAAGDAGEPEQPPDRAGPTSRMTARSMRTALAARREPPSMVPAFRTRAQVLAALEREIRARLDPEAIVAEAKRIVVERAFGAI